MSQFSFRGSPNLQCPVTLSAGLASSSPSPGSVSILNVSASLLPPSSASSSSSAVSSGTIAGGSVGGASGGGGSGNVGGENQSLGSSSLSNTRMAVTSAVIRPPGSPASSVSPSQPHGPPTVGAGPPNTGRCCDTGRPLFTDPVTGQSICSCQYELLGAGYQRLGGITPAALSMYSTPYAAAAAAVASEGIAAYFPTLGAEQTPFYSPTAAGLELKENLGAGAGAAWPYPTVYHPYDAAAFASYPFNGYGVDLNHARRKNATRETTSTLKAWLNEHKKNPYPTKGEKIMLAIITKMTLTQVSTWFANARRRLKKENKMTWEPRNRVEDEDNNNDDDDSGRKSVDEKDRLDSKDSGTGSSEDGERPMNRLDLLHGPGGATGNLQGRMESDWNESRADSGPDSPECLYDQREPSRHPLQLQHPAYLSASHNRLLRHSSPESTSPSGIVNHGNSGSIHLPTSTAITSSSSTASSETGTAKPRIWSLADMASKQDSEHQPNSNSNPTISGLPSPYGGANAPGKIVNPLASRLPTHHPLHPIHSGSQYVRPHPDFYRNFYGASHLGSQDMAFLETYSRTLGGLAMPPTSVPSMLTVTSPSTSSASSNIKSFPLNGNGSGPPVLLTTSSGVSPSASSTSSSNGSDQRSPHPSDVSNHPSTELKSPSRV